MDIPLILIGALTAIIVLFSLVVILCVHFLGTYVFSEDTNKLLEGFAFEIFMIVSGLSLFITMIVPFLMFGFLVILTIVLLVVNEWPWYWFWKAIPLHIKEKHLS